MKPRHIAIAVMIATIWGVNFVVIDVGLAFLSLLLFAGLRFVAAAFPAVLFVRRPAIPWRWFLAVGLSLGVGLFGLLFIGMHIGMPAGLSSVVLQTQALFTALFAAVMLRERPRRTQLGGMAVAFAGIGLIGLSLGQGSPLLAFALCVAAAAMWGLANIGLRRAQPPDAFAVMVWVSLVPPLPLLGLSLLFEGPRADLHALAHVSLGGLGALIYIAYVSTLVGYGIWGWLLRRYGAGASRPRSPSRWARDERPPRPAGHPLPYGRRGRRLLPRTARAPRTRPGRRGPGRARHDRRGAAPHRRRAAYGRRGLPAGQRRARHPAARRRGRGRHGRVRTPGAGARRGGRPAPRARAVLPAPLRRGRDRALRRGRSRHRRAAHRLQRPVPLREDAARRDPARAAGERARRGCQALRRVGGRGHADAPGRRRRRAVRRRRLPVPDARAGRGRRHRRLGERRPCRARRDGLGGARRGPRTGAQTPPRRAAAGPRPVRRAVAGRHQGGAGRAGTDRGPGRTRAAAGARPGLARGGGRRPARIGDMKIGFGAPVG